MWPTVAAPMIGAFVAAAALALLGRQLPAKTVPAAVAVADKVHGPAASAV